MRVVVTLAFVVVLTLLFLTWKSSRYLTKHRSWANLSFWSTIAAILATEFMVRLDGGATLDALFVIHLTFASSFLAVFVLLRFWMTGLRQLNYHKIGGYTCFGLYAGTFVTGMFELWK
jgi:hypothetical protein